MTPKRKQALQWFHDQGEIECRKAHKEAPFTIHMTRRMLHDLQIRADDRRGIWYFTVTDKGRRMLNGDAE